ncbi:uncharacterized protein LOC141497175 [Macrotis lagotis]|uniref:uncharacterized protein LOC141497175 n=1 Tax=Macrotis lagotis TaxID=92651 RepID=UPI003D694A9F
MGRGRVADWLLGPRRPMGALARGRAGLRAKPEAGPAPAAPGHAHSPPLWAREQPRPPPPPRPRRPAPGPGPAPTHPGGGPGTRAPAAAEAGRGPRRPAPPGRGLPVRGRKSRRHGDPAGSPPRACAHCPLGNGAAESLSFCGERRREPGQRRIRGSSHQMWQEGKWARDAAGIQWPRDATEAKWTRDAPGMQWSRHAAEGKWTRDAAEAAEVQCAGPGDRW